MVERLSSVVVRVRQESADSLRHAMGVLPKALIEPVNAVGSCMRLRAPGGHVGTRSSPEFFGWSSPKARTPCKYFVNPIAFDPFQDGLALCIPEGRADATLKKRLENFTLRRARPLRTRTAAARVLHRQMKWCRAGFVSDGRIGACIQKTPHRISTSGAYRAVQRCSSVFVLDINIGSGFEQKANHSDLSSGIPKRAF